jgi:preprotein translocase subunit SecG
MVTLLIVIHVIVCLFLIVIVLLQHGKGADIGATFGGSSQSLFGTEGPVPLLNKITTFAAVIFMLTSVTLAYFSSSTSTRSVMSELKKEQPIKVEKALEEKEAVVPVPVEKQEPQGGSPAASTSDPAAVPEKTKSK